MDEVLNYYEDSISQSDVLERLELSSEAYFLVSVHREENVDSEKNINNYVLALNTIAEKYKLPIIVSTHPRTRKKIESLNLQFHPLVRLMKPLGFSDYIRLQKEAKVVLSDSGTITEESSILNFPAINIREAQERPEGFEEGAVMFTGMNVNRILQAIDILGTQPRNEDRLLNKVADYIAPNVSDKVLRVILSYTDYVNRVVWKKILMKLALIIDDYLPDSTRVAAKMFHELALELQNQGHTVTVITPAFHQREMLVEDQLDGIKVWRFRSGEIKDIGKIKRALNESLLSFRAWMAIKPKVMKDTFDGVIYYSPSIFFGGLVEKIKQRCSCRSYLVLKRFISTMGY